MTDLSIIKKCCRAAVLLLLVCGCLFTVPAVAQKYAVVVPDTKLDSLVNRKIAENMELDGMPGFRIQIYFDSDRKGAQDARAKFMQQYPDMGSYLIYQQPYFKVRVGDFRSRLEAHALYKKLLSEFDKVFIVPDKINFPKL